MYYLSGIDWVIHTLDHASRRVTGCGMNSQVILRLSGILDARALTRAAGGFFRALPCVKGTVSRAGNGAPYWAYRAGVDSDVPVVIRESGTDAEATALCEAAVNQPFPKGSAGVRVIYVAAGSRSLLSLVFDHRVLDARGAQDVLFRLHRYCAGEELPDSLAAPVRDASLSRWKEKFAAGQRVNRYFRARAGEGAVRHIPLPHDPRRPFVFLSHCFGADGSRVIREHAYATAGYLMLAPYLLASTLAVFREHFSGRLSSGTTFTVPVNTDQRRQEGRVEDLLFNHLSFLFITARDAEIGVTREWVRQVSRRMYEAVSGGFAKDLEAACLLMRIVPIGLLERIMQLCMRGQGISFAFSYVHTEYSAGDFCGVPVEEVMHTPRTAAVPGIGVFFTQFAGRLSVTFSYLQGIVGDDEAEGFMRRLCDQLKAGV